MVTLAMKRVKSDQKKVDKKVDRLTQRADNFSRQAGSIERDRAKVETAKKVVVDSIVLFCLLTLSDMILAFWLVIAEDASNKASEGSCVSQSV